MNWEDENMNIGLPVSATPEPRTAAVGWLFPEMPSIDGLPCGQVFIIHGNHDDPAGKGNFSALDELSTAGLLNYFGKQVFPCP